MLKVNRWTVIVIIAVMIWGVVTAMPLVLPQTTRDALERTMPSWYPSQGPQLGLDLQGGSHLLLQADLKTAANDRLAADMDALRGELRKQKIGYQNLRVDRANQHVLFRLRDPAQDKAAALKIARGIGTDLDVVEQNGQFTISMTEIGERALQRQVVQQSIEIIRRRIDETGTKEPVIQAQGVDRVLVQLPGVDDPARMKEILGTTAKLTFHLLDANASATALTLPMQEDPTQKLPLQREALITGDRLSDAQPTYDQSGPAVSFRFDALGSRKFCEISSKNVGQPFAIVLDDKIISAPTIQEAICGGSGVIHGGFTVQQANDLAVLLRAGALPAPLQIIEERTIGPSLGSDSIASGVEAGWVTFVLVLLFLLPTYLLFGVFAAVALVSNIILLFATTMAFGATLTLPGIAGIILTIGMAVDSNVIIFERIREELQSGKSIRAAIDAGFSRAQITIIDANLTTLVAAVFMFMLGSGPIRGFGVTLTFGIFTTVFAATFVTKYLIIWWLQTFKPKNLSL